MRRELSEFKRVKGAPVGLRAMPPQMQRQIFTVLLISILVLVSTTVLYLQTRESANGLLLARALDRAGIVTVAARNVRPDNGVLDRLALGLQDDTVHFACFYSSKGERLGSREGASLTPAHELQMVREAVKTQRYVSFRRPGFGADGAFELWVPLTVTKINSRGVEPQFVPGNKGASLRVLLVVMDASAASILVQRSLIHAILVTLALFVLMTLTVGQVRGLAREQALAAERAAERRFTALGRLSVVLAHEIRNPLGAIKGFAQYTLRRFDRDDPARGDMEVVIAESSRLERLVRSMLLYARPLDPRLATVELSPLLSRALKMVARDAEEVGVELSLKLPDGAVYAKVDEGQFEQALLNLLTNGIEAMEEEGGALEVSLRANKEEIAVLIQDSGVGIAPELLEAVFEPYMTRKARGTGLGLAVVRQVVRAHGGRVEIDSELGRGTTMTVSLPRATEAASSGRDEDGS